MQENKKISQKVIFLFFFCEFIFTYLDVKKKNESAWQLFI